MFHQRCMFDFGHGCICIGAVVLSFVLVISGEAQTGSFRRIDGVISASAGTSTHAFDPGNSPTIVNDSDSILPIKNRLPGRKPVRHPIPKMHSPFRMGKQAPY
jgi:hypothetical protein